MSTQAFTLWLTGITGSGKSTLATMLHDRLAGEGRRCEVLDSGRIRELLNRSLGFTRTEIEQAMTRIAYECKLLNRNGVIAIVAAVSPYRDARQRIREDIENFVEVHCRCPVEVLLERDESGLLGRARRGEVEHVAGINAPYEAPTDPEVVCQTDSETPEQCVEKVLGVLQALSLTSRTATAAYTAEEEAIIKERFRDLGYM